MRHALLVASGAIAYVVGVAIATAALNRPDCTEGSLVWVGLVFIVVGLATAGLTAALMRPGRVRLAIATLVLLFSLATVGIGVIFYALCGMG